MLSFDQRIISTYTRNINNKRADERPVGGGIVIPQKALITLSIDMRKSQKKDSPVAGSTAP